MKRALITGPFGQDGSYLCEILSSMGYEVHGIVRQPFSSNSKIIQSHLASNSVVPVLHYRDLRSYDEVREVLNEVQPIEIYHLAARHYSSELSTLENDRSLYEENLSATFNILSAASQVQPEAKIVLAGSCLMFDESDTCPQDSRTPFKTKSYYGLSKICENKVSEFFKDKGMHVSMAIFYNHESPRRSPNFVTKKIVKNFVQVSKCGRDSFNLGNLDSVKDWGYAKDYVNCMWMMAQTDSPKDYILASGKPRKIVEFVESVAAELDIRDWRQFVNIDSTLVKRGLGATLVGDSSDAKKLLGWRHSLQFDQLVSLMVRSEIANSLD